MGWQKKKEWWEINIDDLEFTQLIGSGASGDVYKGYYKLKLVAIKVCKPRKGQVEDFKKEFSILASIKSPYTVQFFGATTKNKLCMVMEYCKEGSLYGILRNERIEIGWERMLLWLEEIVKGIQHLHTFDPPIMHRDLKTLNVLVTEDFHCRLCDFGLSRFDTSSNLFFSYKKSWNLRVHFTRVVYTW